MPAAGNQTIGVAAALPEANGGVERSHRIHTEEFYEVVDSPFEFAETRHDQLEWETVYNTIRPHQELG
ncbi:MAG: transposase [Chloroflexi bacterium]|nr:transposase [Chloroflexota bacterium]